MTIVDILSETALDTSDEALIRRIDGWIANPPTGSKVLTLSPKVCDHLLTHKNLRNRGKKWAKIERFADDMAKGNWKMLGDTITFTVKGLLGDGQNRLEAAVRADEPLTTHVVFGIKDEDFAWKDRGKVRNPTDALVIYQLDTEEDKKIQRPAIVAQAVRWAHLFDTNPKSRETFEPHEILEMAKDTYLPGGIEDWVGWGVKIHKATRFPAGLAAAVLYHAADCSKSAAKAFAKGWAEGPDTKITPLRKMFKLTADMKAQPGVRIHDQVRAAWAVIAWNQYRRGGRSNVTSMSNWTLKSDFPDFE